MGSTDFSEQVAARLKQADLCQERGRLQEALALYEGVIALDARNFEAWQAAGIAYGQLGQFDKTLEYIRRAAALRPGDFSVHYNLAKTFQALNRQAEALSSYDKALALQPDYVPAYINRGNVLRELKRCDEALLSYDKALSLRPDFLVTYLNRAGALQELRRFDAALASYDQALARSPDYAEANYNKGLLKLLLGDFAAGWPLHEWRWKTEQYRRLCRGFAQPLWLGAESLSGRTILLHADQGLGDAIQMARYVPLVAALGATVILEVQSTLVPLFRHLHGSAAVVARGEALPSFDFHCPLMSLPLAFKTTLGTIPADVPYLSVDPHKASAWRARLGASLRPRIGLAWSGNAMHRNDRKRSISLHVLDPLRGADVEFHAVQKEFREEERSTLAAWTDLHRHADALRDFADTAALIAELDLLITVDTSVAHLAGALGKEVWLLLPDVPDFRWLTDRSDSPWYPSARLFRQDSGGDWPGVIAKVLADLRLRSMSPA